MSTSAIERLRPRPEQVAWRGVPDEAVHAAINDARRSAARQVLDSVEAVPLGGGAAEAANDRLGKTLSDQKVRDALEGWLMNRPVTSVEFNDDLEVRVAVAIDGESFWNELAAGVGDRKDVPFPADDQARDELRRQVLARVEPTVGRAVAKAAGAARPGNAPPLPAATSVDIPRDPPRWVADQLDARASARPVDGRLKTARAAESAARDSLRDKLDKLQLSRQLTLGEAARRDPRVRDAVDHAVQRAKPRKVNYLADGGAEVIFTLDLRDLWYDLESR
jgi:hypothetical protein